MKKLAVAVVLVLAASCAKKKTEEPAAGSAATGSAMTGSATGSATAGSAAGSDVGSAATGSATAGSAATGSAAGSATGSDAGSAAQAGSGDGSAFFAGMDGIAYKDMNKKQRGAYMKKVVLPKARELFSAFDPSEPQVGCKTCHGDGVADHTFKMPNPKLKKLPDNEKAFMAWVSKDKDAARWSKFMAEQLSPEMAKLVGKQPFDPKTKTGEFSCTACHTLKKS